MSELRLTALGHPRLFLDGDPVDINRRKAVALLIYLAATRRSHSREALAALFWPEQDESRSFAYLRQSLWTLRKALGNHWMLAEGDTVALAPNDNFWFDVQHFRRLVADCRTHSHHPYEVCSVCLGPLIEAARLYQDDFLAGFTLPDCPEFDKWQYFEAEKLRRDLVNALERLVHYLSRQGDLDSAIQYAQRWLAVDPLHEPVYRVLMQLHLAAGQRGAALRQYEACVEMLEKELGVQPLEETTALFEAIKENQELPELETPERLGPATLESELGTKPLGRRERDEAPEVAPPSLPIPPTSFVGREQELVEVFRLLEQQDCRLLTLVGPGGVGKTRLALQAASQTNGRFSNGVFFVPLAPVNSDDFLVSTVANILNLSFYGQDDPKQLLLNFLHGKQMLLVLDNFEHLVGGAGLLGEMLSQSPALKIIVTSRERLHLHEEWIYEVGGLRYPLAGEVDSPESYSALQLFMQSARRVKPDFVLDAAELDEAIRICRLVEGVPLALELAAGWVRTLSCAEIAQEITYSLDFLSASLLDLPERHQSLRAVFEHSWALLSVVERRVLSQLSAFRGDFTREAAEQVSGASLEDLRSLMDKSLLRRSAPQRYELHEMVRQYAAEKLASQPDAQREAFRRHTRYYAGFLWDRVEDLRGRRQVEAVQEIRREIENIREGWRRGAEVWDEAEVKKYVEGLALFYELRGWFREGQEILTAALPFAPRPAGNGAQAALDTGAVAMMKSRLGGFHLHLGQYEEGRSHLEQSLEFFRRQGMKREIAYCLNHLGNLARIQGRYDEGRELLQEGIRLARECNDRRKLARALNMLGIVTASTGAYSEAHQIFRASIARLKEIGDLWGAAKALNNLGIVLYFMEQYAEAEKLYRESLRINRQIGDRYGVAISLNNLGLVAHDQAEYEKAAGLHQESLEIFLEIGYSIGAGLCLNDLGKAALALGDREAADEYFSQALRMARELGAEPLALSVLVPLAGLRVNSGEAETAYRLATFVRQNPASDQETRDRAGELLTRLEERLTSAQSESGRAAGAALSLSEAIDLVLYGELPPA